MHHLLERDPRGRILRGFSFACLGMNDDHDAVIRRLRRLGTASVPEGIFDHRTVSLGAVPRRARALPIALTVGAVASLVVGTTRAITAFDGSPRPAVRSSAGPVTGTSDDAHPIVSDELGAPVDPFPDDPCKGPPPFAGQPPGPGDDGAAARQAEAEEWRTPEWRAHQKTTATAPKASPAASPSTRSPTTPAKAHHHSPDNPRTQATTVPPARPRPRSGRTNGRHSPTTIPIRSTSASGRGARYLRAQSVEDPEDLAAEVSLQVVRDLPRFTGDDASLRRWVFTIAHHRLVDHHRHRRRRPRIVAGVGADAPGADDTAHLLDPRLIEALRTLTADQRDVVVLRFVADLGVADVARLLRRRQGAVKALQHRVLANLAARLSGHGADPLEQ